MEINVLTNEELLNISGGGITATFLNSVSRVMETLYKLGQSVGSSIRRVTAKNYCKLS